jgi:putative membrane protein
LRASGCPNERVMTKAIPAAIVIFFAVFASQAFARSDQAFVRTATQANLAEIDVGKLALRRAVGREVRQFATMLVRDHTKAVAGLRRIARRSDLDVPRGPNAEQRATLAKLAALRGRAFDRAFISQMVKNHRKSIELFEEQGRERRSATASFARETLPTLEHHLEEAETLAER